MDILADYLGARSHQDVAEQMIALQAKYWPDAKRSLQPIDVEYLTCECRKYLSYINGTKTFEGKNVFYPGQTPALLYDLPDHFAAADPVDTQIHVLAGGPCSGKTTLLKALAQAGYTTRPETAQTWLEEAAPSERESTRMDPISWQRRVFHADVEMTIEVPPGDLVFCDTSCVENLIFGERAGLIFGPNIQAWLRRYRYRRIFFCEPLATYEPTIIRQESQAVALSISGQILKRYQDLGYDIVRVPALSVEDRVAWVERALYNERN
jgi:predicted ATPase